MIYILDEDPKKCASYLDDKSLNQQIKDIAEILCLVCTWNTTFGQYTEIPLNYYKDDVPLKRILIPKWMFSWAKWAEECKANYMYLVELLNKCLLEYHLRFVPKTPYCRESKYFMKWDKIYRWARDNVPDLPIIWTKAILPSDDINLGDRTSLPLIMPKKYIHECFKYAQPQALDRDIMLVKSYRNFYQAKLRQRKRNPKATYTNREKPEWVNL